MTRYLNLADETTEGLDLTTTYDLSLGNKVFSKPISVGSISLSINADGLTGVLDGTVKLYASNTNVFADAVQVGSTVTLSATPYNEVIVKDIWNSAYMFIEVLVVGVTGGTLGLPLTLKY